MTFSIIGRLQALNYTLTLTLLILLFVPGCAPGRRRSEVHKIELLVENPLNVQRVDEFVVLKVTDLKKAAADFYQDTFIVIDAESNKEVPHQLDDMDNDGIGDEIVMLMDMEPRERKRLIIRYSPESPQSRAVTLGHKRRCRAAMHHEYQGIGWESELVGYSIYLDERNSINVFGKRSLGLSLDTYAKRRMDAKTKISKIFDGGEYIGCGGFGLWIDDKLAKPFGNTPYTRIAADGPLRSVVQITYTNWQGSDLEVTANYSIFAGQQWSSNKIIVKGDAKIACGLRKTPLAKLVRANDFFYTYGNQSSTADLLGMAIIYNDQDFEVFKDDPGSKSYLALLKPGSDGELTYWFLADWSQSELGAKDELGFAKLVYSLSEKLKNPLTVTIFKNKSND